MDENMRPDLLREIGKSYFFNKESDAAKKNHGLKLILEAHSKKDPEATYLVARLLIDKVLTMSTGDPIEHALMLMCSAANNGCIQARAFLNVYCEARYADEYEARYEPSRGRLVDLEGTPIRIDRQGVLTPIDAVLEYRDDCNILTLSTDLMFFYGEEIADPEGFEKAVIRGIMAWQGEYEVFGGQRLRVRVQLTRGSNLFDNILIMPVTGSIDATMRTVGKVIGGKERKAELSELLDNKRSFAAAGPKWSSRSRKIICIQSEDGRFDDHDEIMHVAKHEFGHALGLGDLYSSEVDHLAGVKKGTYTELDSYAITDKYYNLVMCDHHGPISNNDVEMVVLAFRENKMQLYQPSRSKGKISDALGRGN